MRVTPTGSISRYTDPQIQFPLGIAADRSGGIWFTNYMGNTIGRITLASTHSVSPAIGRTAATQVTVAGTATIASVTVPLRVDAPGSVTLRVRTERTGAVLRLQPGSKLGASVLARPATALTASVTDPGAVPVSVKLARSAIATGAMYDVVLTVVPVTGKRTTTTFAFRG